MIKKNIIKKSQSNPDIPEELQAAKIKNLELKLKCFYDLSDLVDTHESSITDLFNKIITMLNKNFKKDKSIHFKIYFHEMNFESKKAFPFFAFSIKVPIYVFKKENGFFEIGFTLNKHINKKAFRNSYQTFVKSFAERLGKIGERIHSNKKFKEYKKYLEENIKFHTKNLQEQNNELTERLEIETALHEILELSIEDNNNDLEQAFIHILKHIFSISWFSVESKGCIFLYNSKNRSLQLTAQVNLPDILKEKCANVKLGYCYCGLAAKNGEILCVNNIGDHHDVTYENMHEHGHICIPIKHRNKLLGLINLYVKTDYKFSKRDEIFLKNVASLLTGIIIRKKTEESLKESQQHFAQIAENINEIFWLIDVSNNKLLYLSSAFEKIFGASRTKVYNNLDSWLDFVYPQDLAIVQKLCKTKFDNQRTNAEFRIIDSENKIKWIRHRIFPIQNNMDEIQHIACLSSDITSFKENAKKEKEHQQRLIQTDKMTSLGIMVSGVGHEINNPNNLIMLNTGMIKTFWDDIKDILYNQADFKEMKITEDIPLPMAIKKYDTMLQRIMDGSERIQQIINDLRNFARLDYGECFEKLNLNEVIKSTLSLTSHLIKKSTNHFNVEYDTKLPLINGNYQKLEQVLINLIVNACQALTDPKQKINIKTSHSDNKITFTIEDEGKGIPSEIKNKIFDPFFTTKMDDGGTGLGLAISYNIIKEHNGKITISSEKDKGTISTIELPIS